MKWLSDELIKSIPDTGRGQSHRFAGMSKPAALLKNLYHGGKVAFTSDHS
jgi:hypothetical protein